MSENGVVDAHFPPFEGDVPEPEAAIAGREWFQQFVRRLEAVLNAEAPFTVNLATKHYAHHAANFPHSDVINGLAIIFARLAHQLATEALPPREHVGKGGRPRGSKSVPVARLSGDVLQMPSDAAMAVVLQTIGAPGKDWEPDRMGVRRPEFRAEHGHVNGSVVYIDPGEQRMASPTGSPAEREERIASLWEGVASLGAAEMQLLMYLSNRWMGLKQSTDGILLNATAYAQERGLDRARAAARGVGERDRFNAAVRNLERLDVHVQIAVRVKGKGKRRAIQTISGRLLAAENIIIGRAYTDPLEGFGGPRHAALTAWWLRPGMAWLASRALAQIGRYPVALLQLNPYQQAFLIRLGAYLGHQTAVRASSGTFAQPLTVGAILNGMHEAIPEDRRLLAKLRSRLENALDALAERGILTSWQWEHALGRGREGLTQASIQFIYHEGSVETHAVHHPAAKRALQSAAVQKLLPPGR